MNAASYVVRHAAARLRAEPEREPEITAEVLRALASVVHPDRVDYGCHVGGHVEEFIEEMTRQRARKSLDYVGW